MITIMERNERNKKYRRRLVLQLVLVLAIIPYGIISIPILTQLHSTNPDFVGIATGIVVAGFTHHVDTAGALHWVDDGFAFLHGNAQTVFL